jgi:hypothetical protein
VIVPRVQSAVPRRIVGYHQDDHDDWVAELECGHGQHVRHDPPWQRRPWVTTDTGRTAHLGTLLMCVSCADQGMPHETMTESRHLLQHFLAAIAYRTQKALRGAPELFADYRAGANVRTPHELLWHMTGVLGYARTMLRGGEFKPPRLPTFSDEIDRLHETLGALRDDLADAALQATISDEQFLQGPLADAMTHAGQLALLRRMAGSPVASENFIFAEVDVTNVGKRQAEPRAPDEWWRADQPPPPPGPGNPFPDEHSA